ncbi:MAG: DUF6737 family protein [Leptolyngbyaceae cyanobacterium]
MPQSSQFSVWQHKPRWCQPWSILLTGITVISGSWLLFHRYWLTGLIALPITAWMGFFILIYPRLMAESVLTTDLSLPSPQDQQPKL